MVEPWHGLSVSSGTAWRDLASNIRAALGGRESFMKLDTRSAKDAPGGLRPMCTSSEVLKTLTSSQRCYLDVFVGIGSRQGTDGIVGQPVGGPGSQEGAEVLCQQRKNWSQSRTTT